MAFDSVPGGDPRGPRCPHCARPIAGDEPSTLMYFPRGPAPAQGETAERWHAECARPYWDKITPVLDAMKGFWGHS